MSDSDHHHHHHHHHHGCEEPHALMSLSFDYEQRSSLLRWHATVEQRSIYMNKGVRAGSLWFKPGDNIDVKIRGGCYMPVVERHGKWHFEVIACELITCPLKTTEVVRAEGLQGDLASPFVPQSHDDAKGRKSAKAYDGVVRRIPDMQLADHGEDEDGYVWMEYVAANALQVIPGSREDHLIGRWDLSFILTVKITDPGGCEATRTFRYDPETEVGNGLNR